MSSTASGAAQTAYAEYLSVLDDSDIEDDVSDRTWQHAIEASITATSR